MRLSFAIIYLTAVAYGQGPAPTVTSVQPNQVNAGGAAFTLTVNGSGFTNGAVVKWSGAALSTSYVSDSQLTATVTANLLAICGQFPITVSNGGSGGTSTGNVTVIVLPVLTSLSPNVVGAGGNGFTITATGFGFSSNVVLTLNASGTRTALRTNYVSTTTLTAFVPASALTGIYPVSLQVTDPTTGAGSQTLPVTVASPDILAILPAKIQAGFGDFVLQVGGVNFATGAQVFWDTTALTTQYVNSGLLYAAVPAALYHDPAGGQVGISVKNPGAPATNSLPLIILPDPYGTRITSLSPATAATGGPSFLLTVNGERFVQGSTIVWQTTPMATTFVSATQLTTTIPASLIAADGSAAISVSTPGVAVSNTVALPIVSPMPTITSVTPASVVAGGPAFTLTVNGSGYVSASRVEGLAGSTTTYVSLTQLTVNVPASAIAAAGTFNLRVINPSGNVSQVTTFAVTPAAQVISSLSPAASVAGGAAFTLTVNGSGFTSNSTIQWNGAALTTTFASSTQLTATVPANLIAAVGTASVTVTGNGSTSNGVAFAIGAAPPTTSTAGIVNAASSTPAIAPGTLISIYGSNLASGNASAGAIPLSTSLGGTTVTINGTAAPLLFVSPGQINAQVPYEVQTGTALLTVKANGTQSAVVNFAVAATGPGVFVVPQTIHAVAVNLPDYTLNSTTAAAVPGQYVTLYVTGQGAVNNPVASGAGAPSSPLSLPLAPVQVQIGGQTADIQFAGLAPGFVGLLQVNVKIPSVPAGDQTVDVSIGGVKASSTTITIGAQ